MFPCWRSATSISFPARRSARGVREETSVMRATDLRRRRAPVPKTRDAASADTAASEVFVAEQINARRRCSVGGDERGVCLHFFVSPAEQMIADVEIRQTTKRKPYVKRDLLQIFLSMIILGKSIREGMRGDARPLERLARLLNKKSGMYSARNSAKRACYYVKSSRQASSKRPRILPGFPQNEPCYYV